MRNGFIKAAAGFPRLRVADCAYNRDRIIEAIRRPRRWTPSSGAARSWR